MFVSSGTVRNFYLSTTYSTTLLVKLKVFSVSYIVSSGLHKNLGSGKKNSYHTSYKLVETVEAWIKIEGNFHLCFGHALTFMRNTSVFGNMLPLRI